MSEFEDIAHKTVVELFDMVKEKVAEIERQQAEIKKLGNLVGQAGCDIDAYQEGVAQLKTQLAIYKEDMRKDAEKIGEIQKRIDMALFEMRQLSLMLSKDIDGYEDPAQICQSEGVDMGVKILEKALRGAND